MHVHVVFIFWEESVTCGNILVVNTVTFGLSVGKFVEKVLDHIGDITKITLSGHVERKLTENSFSEWV